MVEIEKGLGFRAKLDDIAASTLGYGKTGHGLQAIEFFKRGEYDKLRDYCLNDVKVTWEVYLYGLEHGHVKFRDRLGNLKDIPVDFSRKQNKAIAQTLF
jgi:DEAD/DEAH box helicase domain-containing protein